MNATVSRLRRLALMALSLVLLFLAATAPRAAAQGGQTGTRFIFFLRDPVPGDRQLIFQKMAAMGASPAEDLFFPDLGFIGIVGVFPQPVAVVDNDPRIGVIRDVLIHASATLGPAWVRNQFQQTAPGMSCNDVRPVVYVVDTGITATHADFTWPVPEIPALTFAPGFSYAKNTNTNTPIPEYPDNHDHGTRVASCLGGRTTGLLGPLGGRAVVKSVAIFDTPAPPGGLATWASQAINGVLRCVTDHKARKALPWLKNRSSVLVFAHATKLVDGRFAILDNAVEKAWQAGMHVCLSAGNEGVNAALVSPAGAAWGYILPGMPPTVQRFWSGALPPGAALFRAVQEFSVIGAYDLVGGNPQVWAGSNINAGAVTAIDGFAPGANVPCAVAVGGPYAAGSGTSYSAGLAAAMLTWQAWMRPWATPTMARTWFNNSMTVQAGGWNKVETPTLPAAGLTWEEWIEEFYPVAVSTPGQRDPAGDPENDGIANFLEYFHGGDPRYPDTGMDPSVTTQFVGGNFKVVIRMHVACHLPSPAQITWALEKSTDLVTWTPVAAPLSRISPPVINGDGSLCEATGLIPGAQRCFIRVKFSYSP